MVVNNGWKPIDTAPRGRFVTSTFNTSKGERERVDFKPEWIWSFRRSDGHMTPTYWLPKEERWNGYNKDMPPTHWHEYKPEPPL